MILITNQEIAALFNLKNKKAASNLINANKATFPAPAVYGKKGVAHQYNKKAVQHWFANAESRALAIKKNTPERPVRDSDMIAKFISGKYRQSRSHDRN